MTLNIEPIKTLVSTLYSDVIGNVKNKTQIVFVEWTISLKLVLNLTILVLY